MSNAGFFFHDEVISKALRAAFDRAQDPQDALDSIGEIMRGSTQVTFEKEGRPGKWKPLSATTLFLRAGGNKAFRKNKRKDSFLPGLTVNAYKKISGAQILQNIGRLVNSITFKTGNWQVQWGTNVIYAAIHHFGGMAGRNKKVTVPARPFILTPFPEDVEEIRQVLTDEFIAPLVGGAR